MGRFNIIFFRFVLLEDLVFQKVVSEATVGLRLVFVFINVNFICSGGGFLTLTAKHT